MVRDRAHMLAQVKAALCCVNSAALLGLYLCSIIPGGGQALEKLGSTTSLLLDIEIDGISINLSIGAVLATALYWYLPNARDRMRHVLDAPFGWTAVIGINLVHLVVAIAFPGCTVANGALSVACSATIPLLALALYRSAYTLGPWGTFGTFMLALACLVLPCIAGIPGLIALLTPLAVNIAMACWSLRCSRNGAARRHAPFATAPLQHGAELKVPRTLMLCAGLAFIVMATASAYGEASIGSLPSFPSWSAADVQLIWLCIGIAALGAPALLLFASGTSTVPAVSMAGITLALAPLLRLAAPDLLRVLVPAAILLYLLIATLSALSRAPRDPACPTGICRATAETTSEAETPMVIAPACALVVFASSAALDPLFLVYAPHALARLLTVVALVLIEAWRCRFNAPAERNREGAHCEPRVQLERDMHAACLTERERAVMVSLIEGRPLRTIADELGIARATAGTYATRAYRKLGISGKDELIDRYGTASCKSRLVRQDKPEDLARALGRGEQISVKACRAHELHEALQADHRLAAHALSGALGFIDAAIVIALMANAQRFAGPSSLANGESMLVAASLLAITSIICGIHRRSKRTAFLVIATICGAIITCSTALICAGVDTRSLVPVSLQQGASVVYVLCLAAFTSAARAHAEGHDIKGTTPAMLVGGIVAFGCSEWLASVFAAMLGAAATCTMAILIWGTTRGMPGQPDVRAVPSPANISHLHVRLSLLELIGAVVGGADIFQLTGYPSGLAIHALYDFGVIGSVHVAALWAGVGWLVLASTLIQVASIARRAHIGTAEVLFPLALAVTAGYWSNGMIEPFAMAICPTTFHDALGAGSAVIGLASMLYTFADYRWRLYLADAPHAERVALILRRAKLTNTEATVALMLASGLRPARIADELVCSPETIKTHRKRIYAKLRVHSREGLARKLHAIIRRPGKR